jgi:hypothetical protein
LPGKLVAHEPVRGQPPLEEALELPGLAGLEATGISKNPNGELRTGRPRGGGWPAGGAEPGARA